MSALADEVAEQVTVLRGKAEQVEALVGPPRSVREAARADATVLVERRWDWYRALEDAVLDLSNVLPQGTEDYDARKLLEFLVALRRVIADDGDGTDAGGDVELATMALGDVARRLGRRLEHDELDDPNV